MSILLRQIARYVAQRAASNPEIRQKGAKIARGVLEEVKHIAKEDDRAFAAGRAIRRAFDKLQALPKPYKGRSARTLLTVPPPRLSALPD